MEDNQGDIAITKTLLDMPEPSILTFAIIIFVKMCRMELLTYYSYCPSSEEIIADLLTKPLPRELLKCYVKLWEWLSDYVN